MSKKILITGATDGIGLETAKILSSLGHHVLLHGRNADKLDAVARTLRHTQGAGEVETYVADLSRMVDVEVLAKTILQAHDQLDIVINNAGVYGAPSTKTQDGLDIRFAVNTVAPYLLTKRLLPIVPTSGRVINLSSAAQAPVDLKALAGEGEMPEGAAYAQSKLAITMWSRGIAQAVAPDGPAIIAVNPGSMLGSKMVKDAFGVSGGDIRIGADILVRASLETEFTGASGLYFDNDKGQFSSPHPDALNADKNAALIQVIEEILKRG